MSEQRKRDLLAIRQWQQKSAELEALIDAGGEPEWRYFNALQFAMSSVIIDLLVEAGLVDLSDVYERANGRIQILIDDFKTKQQLRKEEPS